MVIHLLDSNNNKTYCGLTRLTVLRVVSDKMLFDKFSVDCKNCKRVVKSIKERYKYDYYEGI